MRREYITYEPEDDMPDDMDSARGLAIALLICSGVAIAVIGIALWVAR